MGEELRVLSTGQVARLLGVPRWQIIDLFDRGIVPEVPMLAGRRMVPVSMLPVIRAAWLSRNRQAPDPLPAWLDRGSLPPGNGAGEGGDA